MESRALYICIWKAKRPGGWLWKPSKKSVCAEVFGIRVRVNLLAAVLGR